MKDRLATTLSSFRSAARELLARLAPKARWVLLGLRALLGRAALLALLVLRVLLVLLVLPALLVRLGVTVLMAEISTGTMIRPIGEMNLETRLLRAMGFRSTSPRNPDPE